MNLLTNKRAVSTIVLIVLLLCFMIIGALMSYLWVMSSYYNMPQNTTLLIVTDAAFPVNNANYFNVTILNPSNSVSDANITAIQLSAEETNEVVNVTETELPGQLPFIIKRGATQTFKCLKNWSNFAGKTVRIEPAAGNVSTKSFSYVTPKVKLNITPNFDATTSIEYFNLTIENSAESVINLTISELMIFGLEANTTPSFPYVLTPNQTEIFRCNRNWVDLMGLNVTINVNTEEGYGATYITNELQGATLYIDKIQFDYTDTSYFNLTISSSEQSTATAVISGINLTLQGGVPFSINETREHAPFKDLLPAFRSIPQNGSRTFGLAWDWSQYRGGNFTVDVHTEQGFAVQPPTTQLKTPPSIVWDITDVELDLDYVDHFLVNVTNMPCSLNEINVTGILLNTNLTTINPPFAVLTNGTEVTFNCSLNWSSLIGKNVTVTVLREDGSNVSRIIAISSVELKLLGDDKLVVGDLSSENTTISIPYVNITVSNSINSLQKVTITRIVFQALNKSYEIDGSLTYPELGPSGYNLTIGENVTIVCPWNRFLYAPAPLIEIIITVYTAEGFQASKTYYT